MNIIQGFGQQICAVASSLVSSDDFQALCKTPTGQYSALFFASGVLALTAYGVWRRRSVATLNQPNLFKDATMGNLRGIKAHIAKGKSVNGKGKPSGNTALHWAAQNGHFGVVKELLSAKADPKIVNSRKQTPLHLACS